MMRFRKTLFLMMLLALTLAFPAMGQPAPSGDNKDAKSSVAGAATVAPATTANSTAKLPDSGGTSSDDKAAPSPPTDKATGDAKGGTAPTSPTAGTATPATNPTPSTMDGATYQVRLRALEQRIDELKEQIRRSHTRLSLLSETILSGGTGGARAEITFINDMSSAFRMTQALFVLDGAVQYNKQDETGLLSGQKEIPIFSGSIPPGDHTLQVLVKLRGHGYGVFSYLQGYRFEIRSSHSFTVTEGKTIELKAIAFEKGDVTTPIEQRPAVRYHMNVRTGLDAGTVPGTTDSKGTASGAQSSVTVSAGSK
jgi:hypothetical protein